MALGILVLITALSISAVAIYYSIAGLVAIFAAAAVPIMIMGGVLEVGKLVTAVWLHKYWSQSKWWLKYYLATAVLVLMFITSMGIFGFLSKAHIEQTSAGEESVAQVQQIESEVSRLNAIIVRADEKIKKLESSGTGADANIQSQIDKEQERIDKAFDRIKPAIEQQNKIITDARGTDANRTKPYEDQLTSITAEILRLETSAKDYETKIENLDADNSSVIPLLENIKSIEEEIIRVTNQLQSTEQGEIRAGQAIIGVSSDGLFGGNTRKALAKWVQAQRDRITQIQTEVSQLRVDATTTVDAERVRLADVVKDIRTVQIPALKARELTMLGKIDQVRQTESPVITTARDEIQRLRESAEQQVAQSNGLINRLRSQLGNKENVEEVQTAIDEQSERVQTASLEIETLTEERIALESEYRKLEAEVGPIKYIAEFVYGEAADKNMLEEAVRWVIMIIIFVFDPLAVLLLIASQYTFDFIRRNKDDDGERLRLERQEFERARAQAIVDNIPPDITNPTPPAQEEEEVEVPKFEDISQEDIDNEFDDEFGDIEELQKEAADQKKSPEKSDDLDNWNKWVAAAEEEVAKEKDIPDTANRMFYPEELDNQEYIMKENGKQVVKETKPDSNDSSTKDSYIQNEEQNDSSLWKRLKK